MPKYMRFLRKKIRPDLKWEAPKIIDNRKRLSYYKKEYKVCEGRLDCRGI